MKALRFLPVLVALFLVYSCSNEGSAGGPAPSIRVEALSKEGQWTEASNFKGKVLVLDFWATWCGPCRESMPYIQAMYDRLKPKGLEVIGITTEERRAVDKYFAAKPIPYPIYLDEDMSANKAFNVKQLPTVVVLDREGNVAFVGHPEDAEMAAAVDKALSQSS
jgi:thiol-disulfide isomerase/thioredoxin